MGNVKTHPPVKLIVGVTYTQEIKLEQIFRELETAYSSIETKSKTFDFTSFTDYYTPEMGDHLSKLFLVFAKLIEPANLAKIKQATNQLENKYTVAEKRQINLDPGYISQAKLVLATTKNYAHRIYLDLGIFGDVHLTYTNQSFQSQPWTYPDYKQPEIIEFFNTIRHNYLRQLGELFNGEGSLQH